MVQTRRARRRLPPLSIREIREVKSLLYPDQVPQPIGEVTSSIGALPIEAIKNQIGAQNAQFNLGNAGEEEFANANLSSNEEQINKVTTPEDSHGGCAPCGDVSSVKQPLVEVVVGEEKIPPTKKRYLQQLFSPLRNKI